MSVAPHFYDASYSCAAIFPSDFVVVAKHRAQVVCVGRLSQDDALTWFGGMQVEPAFQRQDPGCRILTTFRVEIGVRLCCDLAHEHQVDVHRNVGFEPTPKRCRGPLPTVAQGSRARDAGGRLDQAGAIP